MRLRMLWYQFRMLTIRDGVKRTAYLKKRNVYAGIGENVMIQSRKIPLYPELIRIGNNVRMASNVLFVTHDVVHNMLNRISPKTEKILVGGVFHEKVGCIEIGNNVFIGTGSIILYDTKIGSNVIVAAGSIITKDVPDNVVVAGIPAKVIGTFDTFLDNLKSATKLFSVLLASKRPLITELADKLRLKYPLLPTISPCPTMRLEAIRSIIPISCRRYPKSV